VRAAGRDRPACGRRACRHACADEQLLAPGRQRLAPQQPPDQEPLSDPLLHAGDPEANEYPDLKQYSSAIDDIQRALLAAIHEERGNGGGSGPPSSSGGGGGGGSGGGGNGQGPGATRSGAGSTLPADTGKGGGSQSPVGSLFHPANAQSIPLPLIVLAALAVLLLLAGAGTWLARRFQARRMTPAPAPPPR